MTRFFTVPLCLILSVSAALAQTTPPSPPETPLPAAPATDTPKVPSPANPPVATPSPTPTATPAPKNIDETVKNWEKIDGLWTIYRRVERNRQQFYAEIRESQLTGTYLLQSTFATGNAGRVVAGRPAGDTLLQWQQTPDDRLILTAPNPWYRTHDPHLKDAVARDFPPAFLGGFPIIAHQKDRKSVLIDLGQLLDGSVIGLGAALEGAPGGPNAYVLDQDLSFVQKVKNFPLNLVVEVQYHFKRRPTPTTPDSETQADPRSLPVQMVYNLYPISDDSSAPGGYQPRRADPRVGYFINGMISDGRVGFQSFDDDTQTDPRVLYINRWRLEKTDPIARLSRPVKPITFLLDTSIPEAYREAARQGILGWNKAFLRLGFQDAIVVKDAPKDKDFDHADMRYNVIRWVTSPPTDGGAYAVAQMRENPLTGEMVNASITVNANFARFAYREEREVVKPLGKEAGLPGGTACALNSEWHDMAAFGYEAAEAAGVPLNSKQYAKELLRNVISHEFGHILGLRHNFLASTYHSPAALANKTEVRRSGVTASVMDYTGFNLFGLKSGAPLFPNGPEIYDQWAIEYGYRTFAPGQEKAGLKAIAARSVLPGHAYQTDDTADETDPTVVRYDLSADPLAYTEKTFAVTRELLRTLPRRYPRPGETYSVFTMRLRGLLRSDANNAVSALRYIGGARTRRVIKGGGSKEEPYTPVSEAEQRRALAMISRYVLGPDQPKVPEEFYRKTTSDPYNDTQDGAYAQFAVRDLMIGNRGAVLASLLSPARLSRMANQEFKFPQRGMTLHVIDLLPAVRNAVWGTLTSKSVVGAAQRDLQKAHLQILLDYSLNKKDGAPKDVRALAENELRVLRDQLVAPSQGSPDAYTRMHCAEAVRRINNAIREKLL